MLVLGVTENEKMYSVGKKVLVSSTKYLNG